MGSIHKRGSVYWIKYYRNGKAYRESSGSKKHIDAKRLLKKREGEISNGKIPGIYFDRVMFEELVEDLKKEYRVNGKKSFKTLGHHLKHLKDFFADWRVTQITSPRINEYIEIRKEEGSSNATVNRELAALKRMLNLGANQTPPKVDRVPYIPMLRENNVRKGFFEHREFLALRDALPEYLRGFVTFAYKTGWRRSEISSLKWSQVDLKNSIVRLEKGETKNDEGRTVYLDEELVGVFEKQQENSKKNKRLSPFVFTNPKGDKIKDFRKTWSGACTQAGTGKRLFHDFRRTAVRNMVRAGVPEQVAMMASGHKTRSVFDRYNIVNDTDLKLASQKQQAYLKSQLGTISGTIADFPTKKGAAKSANPL